MAKPLLSNELWAIIKPLLPPPPPRRFRHPGRKRLDERAVLTGVLFVLKTGIPWEDLPREMGCGCGMTCLRRLRHWQRSGAWLKMQDILKQHMRDWARYDWSRVLRGERSPLRVRSAYREHPSKVA